jgi:hypothetical protein
MSDDENFQKIWIFPQLDDDEVGDFIAHCTLHAVDLGEEMRQKGAIVMTMDERFHHMAGIRMGIASTLRVLSEMGALRPEKLKVHDL